MQTWIALFRGINVGGKNKLSMARLKDDLELLNLKNVRTYIQSGNVVFDSTARTRSSLAKKIGRRVEERHGFRPHVLILDREDLILAIESNPFTKVVSEPKTLHFFFLAEPPSDPDMKALEDARASTERYKLTKGVFYLHTPAGLARSKLASNAEKHLGVAATARNYRTVEKLRSMIADS